MKVRELYEIYLNKEEKKTLTNFINLSTFPFNQLDNNEICRLLRGISNNDKEIDFGDVIIAIKDVK